MRKKLRKQIFDTYFNQQFISSSLLKAVSI